MPSWVELEQRFLALEPALRSARLDCQTGSAGEYWRVAAAFDTNAKARFESLSTMAGRKVTQSFESASLPKALQNSPSDQVRWYRLLAQNLRFYRPGPVGYETDEAGVETGWIATGSIENPAAVAATQCLELAAMMNEEEAPKSSTTIHVSGQNTRLNIQSVDNSINTVAARDLSVFEHVHSVISRHVSEPDATLLLSKLDELKSSVTTDAYPSRYSEFIQLAANHITILTPFIAPLSSFLK